MTNYFKRFVVFLREKQLSQDFENIPKAILNNYLRYFYSQLKSPKSGELYSPCTLVCIRAGLHRYFTTQLRRKDIHIIRDREFFGSNQMLKSMVMKFKTSNKPQNEEKYPAIESEDMVAIRSYFNRSTPVILQDEIIFNLLYCIFFISVDVKLFHISAKKIFLSNVTVLENATCE